MPTATRTVAQALATAQAEATRRTQDWTNHCLIFVRTCWGIPAQQPTAYDAWLACPASRKHAGGDPADAPVGAALCYKGSDPAGHIMLAAHGGAWSNDLDRTGYISKVARTDPITKWGHRYLGYILQVNGIDLPIDLDAPHRDPEPAKPAAPPKPGTANATVTDAEAALRKARNQHLTPGTQRYKTVSKALAALKSLLPWGGK